MRARSTIVALSLQLMLSGVFARAAAQEKLVVVNSRSSEAAVIDPETQEILARLPTGPQPRQVATSPDGRFAYVASAIASQFGGSGEAVTVLDLVGHSVVNSYTIDYGDLHDIRVSRDGLRLWLTAEADSGIVELDAATGQLLMLWKTGGAKSHTLVATPNNRKLYVANANSDSVSVINRQTTVAGRIPTGAEPEGLDVSPVGGKWLWVANRGDNTLTIINTRKDRREATLDSGGEDPIRVRFRPDGHEVWVSNRTSKTVTIFDAYSRELLGSVELAIQPWDIVFSADSRRAFVSAPEQNEVHIVDVATREVVGSFYAGAQPLGMAWVTSGLRGDGTVAK